MGVDTVLWVCAGWDVALWGQSSFLGLLLKARSRGHAVWPPSPRSSASVPPVPCFVPTPCAEVNPPKGQNICQWVGKHVHAGSSHVYKYALVEKAVVKMVWNSRCSSG